MTGLPYRRIRDDGVQLVDLRRLSKCSVCDNMPSDRLIVDGEVVGDFCGEHGYTEYERIRRERVDARIKQGRRDAAEGRFSSL